jgi:potassium/sodium efflux P-type ATPase
MEGAKSVPYAQLLADNEELKRFLDAASLANLAKVHIGDNGEWHARGDPTEIAIEVFACRFDWYREKWTKGDNPKWTQIAEFPFDSDVKRMSVIYANNHEGAQKIFVKGAVERILDACTEGFMDSAGGSCGLTSGHRDLILRNVDELSKEGLRVLALASKTLKVHVDKIDDEALTRGAYERDLQFLGLIGLYDPPRPESAGAVQACHRAGVSVHMLTGDHPGTARSIASQVGILPKRMGTLPRSVADSMVMTASTFDKLSDAEIDKLPVLPLVIARCAPQTKVRMVEALHRRNCFAAMTGDGVNDSPSLKRADVGIAMGQSGSDVAKDASDIVLTDDNFASILNAVEEGRRMFDNIQKFVLHLLAQNIAQAGTLLIGLAFKDRTRLSVFPLAPVEILWVIMVTSGVPDMGLGFERAAPDILERPPQSLQRGIFTLEIMLDMLVYGWWMTALCLASFVIVMYHFGDGNLGRDCNNAYSAECDLVFRARATTFVCMTWFSLFLAWEMVSLRRSFFRMQPGSKRYMTQWMLDVWRNPFLFWAVLAGFVTIFPTLYIPVINHDVFKHTGITWEWGVVLVEAVLFVAGVEGWKWAKRVYFRHRKAARARKAGAARGGGEDDLEAKAFGPFLSASPSEERPDVAGVAGNATSTTTRTTMTAATTVTSSAESKEALGQRQ